MRAQLRAGGTAFTPGLGFRDRETKPWRKSAQARFGLRAETWGPPLPREDVGARRIFSMVEWSVWWVGGVLGEGGAAVDSCQTGGVWGAGGCGS